MSSRLGGADSTWVALNDEADGLQNVRG